VGGLTLVLLLRSVQVVYMLVLAHTGLQAH
jgi:hypothetical protein